MKKLLTTINFIAIFFTCNSQVQVDTIKNVQQNSLRPNRIRADTTFYQTKNITKNRFWGNSTYISSSINASRNKEFDFNLGRTNGVASYSERGLGYYSISSWGFGYGLTNSSNHVKQSIKAFYEYNFFPFIIIGNFGVRGEYIYNISDKKNYLRPSIGFSFVYVDIFYNYSFLLNGNKNENLYRNGLTIRAKYFFYKKNWETNTFVRQKRL